MDENIIISMILHGCELARRLEAHLPSMVMNQSNSVSDSCIEIIGAFMAALEKLQMANGALSVEEWLRSSIMLSGENQTAACVEMAARGVADQIIDPSISRTLRGSGAFQTGQSSESSRPESSTRPRQRNQRDGRRTVRMAAPRMGNTEIPPEDGFTWRKYGQKEILGSRFPRAYFRCTHQRLYHCPAKKQVQRLDQDPDIFEVTYRNDHTCHLSATAPGPSAIRPKLIPDEPTTTGGVGNCLVPAMSQQFSTSTTYAGTTWLSMGIGCPRTSSDPNPFMDPRRLSYEEPVMDMADTMFNSGSSSNNSMDQIFSSIAEEKWDQAGGDVSGKKHI